jgi:hypothetical protein
MTVDQTDRIPISSEYTVRRERGFVRSTFVVSTPENDDWGRFTRPLRPAQGCLALIVAPAVFLGLIVLAGWLTGAFDDRAVRNARPDPNPYIAVPIGLLYAALVFASPMIITQWIYPANCMVLRSLEEPGDPLLEVRDRMVFTAHSKVHTIRGPSREVLATVRHDLFTRRFELCDADGRPILYAAAEKSVSPMAEAAGWYLAVGLVMILAAVLFRTVAVPGTPSGRKGKYYLWLPDAFRSEHGQPSGQVKYTAHPAQAVEIQINDEVAPDIDPRLIVGLAAAVLVS